MRGPMALILTESHVEFVEQRTLRGLNSTSLRSRKPYETIILAKLEKRKNVQNSKLF
jgi:hypothetical protein